MNDPIVDEVRRVRDAHAARFNYDLDAIFRNIKEQEKKSGRKFVSPTNSVEIFIPLLNEGTDVLRPAQGLVLGPHEVQVLATPDYDPTIEEWEFPPGSKVQCAPEIRGGRELLVARQRIA